MMEKNRLVLTNSSGLPGSDLSLDPLLRLACLQKEEFTFGSSTEIPLDRKSWKEKGIYLKDGGLFVIF